MNRNIPNSKRDEKCAKITPELQWKAAIRLLHCRCEYDAFTILVALARQGDAEAQFVAHSFGLLKPALLHSTAGLQLTKLPVEKSPFKHKLDRHPAAKLFASMGLGIAQKARDGDGQSALIMALFHANTQAVAGKKKSSGNTALTLNYLNRMFKDNAFMAKMTAYHVELVRRNVAAIVEAVKPLPKSNDVKFLHFADGTKAKVSRVCKVYSRAIKLQNARLQNA